MIGYSDTYKSFHTHSHSQIHTHTHIYIKYLEIWENIMQYNILLMILSLVITLSTDMKPGYL